VCPLPLWFRGKGHTRWRERGRESPNPDEETNTVVLFIYVYFVGTNLRTIRERKYMSMLESSASNMMGCQVLNISVKL
jgi:hypothetical protein